jgi:formylglycine-generating enzyme required for sulfatase activity
VFLVTGLPDYAADQATTLADLLMDAEEEQFAVLFPKFREHGEKGVKRLLDEIDKQLVGATTEDDKEKLAKRQANAAVALLKMDRPEKVWPLFTHSPDPRRRSYLIHRLSAMSADARVVVQRLEEESDLTIRRALVLALGEYPDSALSPGERDSVVAKLREWYGASDDPGLHAAAEWALRQWKQQPWLKQTQEEWAKSKKQRDNRLHGIRQRLVKDEAKPQWYIDGQGLTMAVIPGPVEFLMGSPTSESERLEAETLHRQRIGHSFSIAAKLVTVEQYLRFRMDYDPGQFAPTDDCPVLGMDWYQAAEYCNWLSKQEGLPETEWCYEPNSEGNYEAGMKPTPDFLNRSGYRLPTEAEWEYACRAGAVTSRYYGQSEELLAKYGWYYKNSGERSRPVGSLKPNDLGLFDIHGNAWEWCHNSFSDYTMAQGGKAAEDAGDTSPVLERAGRVLRGGGANGRTRSLRCAYRTGDPPGYHAAFTGFRPARTYN